MTDTTSMPDPTTASALPDSAASQPNVEPAAPSLDAPAPAQPTEVTPPAEPEPTPEPAPPAKPLLTVVQAARRAKQQLQEITGLEVATVSAMEEYEGGWRAYVNLVELRRVPTTSDVLATYEAVLDAQGELETYKRLRRFLRGQVND
ncbi:gas vesicle protein GvpO [Algihabitans albus]|uniref:gas vesicle protein GvpO n=1 Tax=Algihabitans albus TaxID=2164067 RepID=UPI000E5D691E|nr:gas vesicle protein [Algihabitans albus]